MKVVTSIYTVTDDEAGQRLDNLLLRLLKNVPKSRIYKMIRKGEVRINKGRRAPEYKLILGDKVRIPPHHATENQTSSLMPNSDIGHQLQQSILFEDKSLLVINKPIGLMAHGNHEQLGLIEHLQGFAEYQYCELAHRLDKDTSGCLIIAKRRSILRQLHQLFRSRQVRKKYLALVHGIWSDKIINKPLQRYLMPNGERRVRVHSEGQKSITRFKILTEKKHCSLLEVMTDTGRTHQIRVHCQSVDHPIVGDDKYGNRHWDKQLDKQLNQQQFQQVKRLCLHASEVNFIHPVSEQRVSVQAECTPFIS